MLEIKQMKTEQQVHDCFKVMSQLRPHIIENEFIEMIQQQFKNGYQLVSVLADGNVVAVAGFHIRQNLAWGKYLYIEDLITEQNFRSNGLGKKLLVWLHHEAKNNQCKQLHLDSGIKRKDAHRFYEREGMTFASHHYVSHL